jgi:rhodanese-related sulfurtransferase
MKIRNWLILLVMVGLLAPSGTALAATQVPYISVDTLKTLLGFKDVMIIDVRAPQDWDKSDSKIKGAVRQDPKQVKAWASKLDKDAEIVLYCA